MNSNGTEVMNALYGNEKATFYINKNTGLFITEIKGAYHTGWKLGKAQLEAFLKSGNLN